MSMSLKLVGVSLFEADIESFGLADGRLDGSHDKLLRQECFQTCMLNRT